MLNITAYHHLGVGSHKKLDMKRYVCIKTYLYDISGDMCSSLANEMHGL